jgi:hypothetical protein
VALGGDAGVLGMQMSGKTGERGGSGLFIWRVSLDERRGWSGRPGLALARMGGGVSMLGLGVRGKRVFGGTWVARGAETDVPTDRSHPRAGVRWWPRWPNGQEGRCGYASRVLVSHGVCVFERNRPRVSVG